MPVPLRTAQRLGSIAGNPWWVVALALCVLYGPTLLDLFQGIWATDQQGYGPVVLGLSGWLIWRGWAKADLMPVAPRPRTGWALVLFSQLLYILGRSQGILIFEVGSCIPLLTGVVLILWGWPQLKSYWFVVFFMCFLVPLPGPVVDALTQPMKLAVSMVAEQILYSLGYPISRTGVTLQVGSYQLLVADACAGLHTLFVLEAMGLLYLNVVRVSSALRNVVLACLIVPISFMANTTRVIVLVLVTYYLGDEAGQGFLHGFAGIVLFLSALLFIITADSLLRFGRKLSPRGAG